MHGDRKVAQGGQEPPTQDRTNKENGKQKNYLKKDLTRLLTRLRLHFYEELPVRCSLGGQKLLLLPKSCGLFGANCPGHSAWFQFSIKHAS